MGGRIWQSHGFPRETKDRGNSELSAPASPLNAVAVLKIPLDIDKMKFNAGENPFLESMLLPYGLSVRFEWRNGMDGTWTIWMYFG